MIIQILYILASFIGVIAMVPQVKQLLITRQSDEFNLSTWMSWMACQGVATVYAVTIGAMAYVAVSTVWAMFYALMVILIIKYKRPNGARQDTHTMELASVTVLTHDTKP